jgi:UDP-glucuronate 4-epimerase
MRTHVVTGAAGFIGFHVSKYLIARGDRVIGIDSINDYYDPSLKHARLARLTPEANFEFHHFDVANREALLSLYEKERPERTIHLAAQAGVRYSLQNPYAYADANLAGFLNILEACRHNGAEHLTYASSSSVYGANTKLPFSVGDSVDHPVSLYAATKKANELMAHCYSHLYRLPTTGLRFFTVYGPWGRPDMAMFKFAKAILAGEPIDVYNHGQMRRDFTFVDDIVEGVVRVSDRIAAPNPDWDSANPDPGTSNAPYRIYNIGNHQPVELMELIRVMEEKLGRKAELNMMPIQPGDVLATCADVENLTRDVDFHPNTPIEVGVGRFLDWYMEYFGAKA